MERVNKEWHIGSIGRNAGRKITINSHKDPLQGHCIATIHSRSHNAEANARLIAAAPDLLAACEELVEVCSYLRDAGNDDDSTLEDAITQGHAAMAKTTKQA